MKGNGFARHFCLWCTDVTTDSKLEPPRAIFTADLNALRGRYAYVARWAPQAGLVEFHRDPSRGWPFMDPGEGPWRIDGVPELLSCLDVGDRPADRIEGIYTCARELARVLPGPIWDVGADNLGGLLGVAIAEAQGRSLSLGTTPAPGALGLAASRHHGVSISARPLPEAR